MIKRKNKIISSENVDTYESYEVYEGEETKILLEMYLSKLNPIYAEAIKLKYLLDLDYETISVILNIPVGTVKSRISNGLKILKKMVGGENEDA